MFQAWALGGAEDISRVRTALEPVMAERTTVGRRRCRARWPRSPAPPAADPARRWRHVVPPLDPLTRVDSLRMFGHVARRLDGLRVQNRRSRLGVPAGRPADLAPQRIVDRLGDAFLLPQGEVAAAMNRRDTAERLVAVACAAT